MEREGRMQTYLVRLRGEDEDDGDDRLALAGHVFSLLVSCLSLTLFFLGFLLVFFCPLCCCLFFRPLRLSSSVFSSGKALPSYFEFPLFSSCLV
jgi:hypothetical protein